MTAHKVGFLTLLALVPAATLWAVASHTLVLAPESRLWIEGNSTVRRFQCEAAAVEAEVHASAPDATAAILAGEKAVTAATVRIPARRLDCRNGTMNEHMLKALKASEHPSISFRLAGYDLEASGPPRTLRLEGTLSVGGAERPAIIEAIATEGPDGALRVTGSYELSMTEYGLTPPKLFLGTLKVHERVTVGFDLYLKG